MSFLIPIREFAIYIPPIFILFSLGSFTISSLLYQRIFSRFSYNRLQVNNIWNSFLLCFGITFIPIKELFHASFFQFIFYIFFGCVIGFLILKVELKFNRLIFRANQKTAVAGGVQQRTTQTGSLQINEKMASFLGRQFKDHEIKKKSKDHYSNGFDFNFHFRDLIVCAILEEIIYRGLVFIILNHLISIYAPLAIVITSVFFGIMHLSFGQYQWLNKTVMGFILGVIVFSAKSIYPALGAHIVFNSFAYHYIKSRTKKQCKIDGN